MRTFSGRYGVMTLPELDLSEQAGQPIATIEISGARWVGEEEPSYVPPTVPGIPALVDPFSPPPLVAAQTRPPWLTPLLVALGIVGAGAVLYISSR